VGNPFWTPPSLPVGAFILSLSKLSYHFAQKNKQQQNPSGTKTKQQQQKKPEPKQHQQKYPSISTPGP
jgi:hypothetical protein